MAPCGAPTLGKLATLLRLGRSKVGNTLKFALHSVFDEKLFAAYSAVSAERNKDDPWNGRWDGGNAYPRWKFAAVDGRPALLAAAWDQDSLVGTISLRPMMARWRDIDIRAGELGDLYVAPRARGQGVFGQLTRLIAEGAQRHGYEFVFSVPNSQGYGALLAGGDFAPLPQAERMLCVLPLRPSVFMPRAARAAGRIVVDPVMRAVLPRGSPKGFVPWIEATSAGWADFRTGSDALYMDESHLAQRLGTHPDRTRYQVMGGESAWCIAKPTSHRGRGFFFLGAVQGATPRARRGLLRTAVSAAARDGYVAVAVWADRSQLGETIGVSTPFVPVSRKRVVVLRSGIAAEVLEQGAPVKIELLDTDKI